MLPRTPTAWTPPAGRRKRAGSMCGARARSKNCWVRGGGMLLLLQRRRRRLLLRLRALAPVAPCSTASAAGFDAHCLRVVIYSPLRRVERCLLSSDWLHLLGQLALPSARARRLRCWPVLCSLLCEAGRQLRPVAALRPAPRVCGPQLPHRAPGGYAQCCAASLWRRGRRRRHGSCPLVSWLGSKRPSDVPAMRMLR